MFSLISALQPHGYRTQYSNPLPGKGRWYGFGWKLGNTKIICIFIYYFIMILWTTMNYYVHLTFRIPFCFSHIFVASTVALHQPQPRPRWTSPMHRGWRPWRRPHRIDKRPRCRSWETMERRPKVPRCLGSQVPRLKTIGCTNQV